VDNFVMRADFRDTIEAPWTKMDPVRIGPVPPGLPTPAAFVTVEENDSPLLRIDLFPQAEATAYAFREALVWRDFVVIGFGSQLHLISPSTRTVETLGLTDYFGNLYPLPDCLLVADAKFLRRVNTNGSVAWRSDWLGIDGVVVIRVEDDTVVGEGEWDPPGGWRPFRILLASGQPAPGLG
jgi:hypothetical protein